MLSSLCDLFTPFQNRVGFGQDFNNFQKTTFGTLKTIPLDGVELTRLMLAIGAIEKKFDVETNKFFKTPEEWKKLEKKLNHTYFASNQDPDGLQEWLQQQVKNRNKRNVLRDVNLEFQDVLKIGVFEDQLTIGEFVEPIAIDKLGEPTNFVKLLRAVAVVSSNTIDFSLPFYVHMAIMLLPVHEFFLDHDVSEFVKLLRADIGEPPYRHYNTDPMKDQFKRNGTDSTGQVAHSPSFDQTEIILSLIKRPYRSELAYQFTQNINRSIRVSTSDTKTKMKDFIAQLQTTPPGPFFIVSDESCRIDLMKLPDVKTWLRTTYYRNMGDLQSSNLSFDQKFNMRRQIVKSFRGGFENVAVWEVGLKIMDNLFPKRTTTYGVIQPHMVPVMSYPSYLQYGHGQNSGNSNMHVHTPVGYSMTSGPQKSDRSQMTAYGTSSNCYAAGSSHTPTSSAAQSYSPSAVWDPTNNQLIGNCNFGGSSPGHASSSLPLSHYDASTPRNLPMIGNHSFGGANFTDDSSEYAPTSASPEFSHSGVSTHTNPPMIGNHSIGGANFTDDCSGYAPTSASSPFSHSGVSTHTNLPMIGNHSFGSANFTDDSSEYAPTSASPEFSHSGVSTHTNPPMIGNPSFGGANFTDDSSGYAPTSASPEFSHSGVSTHTNPPMIGNHSFGDANFTDDSSGYAPTSASPEFSHSGVSTHTNPPMIGNPSFGGANFTDDSSGYAPTSASPEFSHSGVSTHTNPPMIGNPSFGGANFTDDSSGYAPTSASPPFSHSDVSNSMNLPMIGDNITGGASGVCSASTSAPTSPAHACTQSDTPSPTNSISGNSRSTKFYDAQYAGAVEFVNSDAWSPTNTWSMQQDDEWDRIMRDFNVPI